MPKIDCHEGGTRSFPDSDVLPIWCFLASMCCLARLRTEMLLTISVYGSLRRAFPHLSGQGCSISKEEAVSSVSSPQLSKLQIVVGNTRPQQQAPDRSGQYRTSTTSSRSQWALPDLNSKLQIAVGTTGPQQQAPDRSGQYRTSTASSRSQRAPGTDSCQNKRQNTVPIRMSAFLRLCQYMHPAFFQFALSVGIARSAASLSCLAAAKPSRSPAVLASIWSLSALVRAARGPRSGDRAASHNGSSASRIATQAAAIIRTAAVNAGAEDSFEYVSDTRVCVTNIEQRRICVCYFTVSCCTS